MTTVEYGCPSCGRAVELAPGASGACRHCGAAVSLPEAGTDVEACLACGCEELYRHRDFNQKLGLAIIAAGAGLCFVWPYWPLALAAVVDFALYKLLPDVGICYRCKAHHRGFGNVSRLSAFDLERFEHHRFTKAREEGRLPPRTQDDAGG